MYSANVILLFIAALAVGISSRPPRGQNKIKRAVIIKNKNKVPINMAVEDIKESTDFAGRERKVKLLMEGEMYAEHENVLAKRKEIKHAEHNKALHSNIDAPEVVRGEKKSKIEKHQNEQEETLPEAFGNEDYDDSNGNNDDLATDLDTSEISNEESGSGSAEPEALSNKSEEESDENGSRRGNKLRCRKKCAVPMTYHECAHPRCSQKLGAIKDLCFYLCKHQKERCEDVCD